MADQYEELRRLAAEATPGPWFVDQDKRPGMQWNRSIDDSANKTVCFMAHSDGKDDAGDTATADFIAAANPQTIAAILADLDALRAATIKQSLTVQTDYTELRRAIASGNPLTVYMHREAMMTPLDGDVRELVRELDALREDARKLRNGNTALLEALMDMVLQHCTVSGIGDDDVLRHGYLSANEAAIEVLEEAGMVANDRLDWPALQRRKDAALPSKDADRGEVGNG